MAALDGAKDDDPSLDYRPGHTSNRYWDYRHGHMYSKFLQSYKNCSVTMECFQDANNHVCLLYSKDFKVLVGILYAIFLNPILKYCILFQPIRIGHSNAVTNISFKCSFIKYYIVLLINICWVGGID